MALKEEKRIAGILSPKGNLGLLNRWEDQPEELNNLYESEAASLDGPKSLLFNREPDLPDVLPNMNFRIINTG